jgi:hypothetical protein
MHLIKPSLILPEVERLSITLFMDNYTDRQLPSSDQIITRPPMTKNEGFLPPPIAEHGFSALIEVCCNNESERGMFNNVRSFFITITFLDAFST